MKIVAVDPRRVGIASQADVLLQVRPGSDGALALSLIDVAIKAKLFDEHFVRHWTNGPFLIRKDNGAALTEADLTRSGSADRFVAWDDGAEAPIVYDSSSGTYERPVVRPAIAGERCLGTGDGRTIVCEPAFARLAALAASYAPESSSGITWVPAEKVFEGAHLLFANPPVSIFMYNGVGQHTNATQTSRAIAIFYALLGDIDRPGGNVVFSIRIWPISRTALVGWQTWT